MKNNNDFYVAAYEMGVEQTPVATWASHSQNPLELTPYNLNTVQRHELTQIPASFQLTNLLTPSECQRFIEQSEALGYSQDASVSLPRKVRQNENVVWIIDDVTHDILWERCQALITQAPQLFQYKKAVALNKRFRFYKYSEGDFFKPHTDGAWPGSAIINEKVVYNTYPKQYSEMTFLILLSDDFEGGETAFYVHKDDAQKAAKRTEDVSIVEIKTPRGGVLCFPHGTHPQHCLHGSREILKGVKYIIRTDLLFAQTTN